VPVIVVTIILIRGLKSKSWQKMALNDSLDGKTNELPELSIGMTGSTISTLKPSGKAIIDENVVEVQSLDGFIDENSIIEIVSLKENKIFVTKMNKL
jgi:membrane-bound serine protease (ClpP class)